MGLGFALTENFVMEDGYVKSKYATLGLLRAPATPPIEVLFVEKGSPDQMAFGAKGVGEICAIPTAPGVSPCTQTVSIGILMILPDALTIA